MCMAAIAPFRRKASFRHRTCGSRRWHRVVHAYSPVRMHSARFVCTQHGSYAHSTVRMHAARSVCAQPGSHAGSLIRMRTVDPRTRAALSVCSPSGAACIQSRLRAWSRAVCAYGPVCVHSVRCGCMRDSFARVPSRVHACRARGVHTTPFACAPSISARVQRWLRAFRQDKPRIERIERIQSV